MLVFDRFAEIRVSKAKAKFGDLWTFSFDMLTLTI